MFLDYRATISGTPEGHARDEVVRRRAFRRLFSIDFATDPAGDILLALFLAREQSVKMSANELTIEVAQPSTAVDRWLKFLSNQGHVEIGEESADGSSPVALTTTAHALLLQHFA